MPQEVVNLVIGVKGATEATKSLQTLDKLVAELNNKKVTLSVDTASIQTFSKEMEKSVQLATQNINAQARLLKQKNQEISLNLQNQRELTKQAELQAKVALEAQKTQQAIEKTAQAQANAQTQAQKTAQEQAKVTQQAEKTAQAEAKLATEAQKTATIEERRKLLAEQMSATYERAALAAQGMNQAEAAAQTETAMQKRINALTGVSNSYKSAAESAKFFQEIEKKVGASTGQTYAGTMSTAGFQSYIRGLEGMQNATVAATRTVKVGDSTFQQFDVSVRKATGDYDNFTYSVDTGTKSMYKAENGMSSLNKTAGKVSQTLGNMVMKFAQWYLIGTLVSAPIRALSDALSELKKVDSELVNIQKVMGATAGEMEKLSEKAFEVGSSLGVAASDYLASVTKWAQAGYGSLSDELGELSVKTQKVGDVQEETANQFLLSVDAAYKYKGNIAELTKVLDGANEISNNYATSVEKLAGGMGIVSSLAAQAGMKVEETMAAIGTITAVTQESGNSAARALRALILNIQGSTEIAIDEETGERWTEDEIQQMAVALGDLNIATREYKDGVEQLRNPMEVIGELSQKYRDGLVSEVQLQNVVSALGGKVRSNQLQALISNYDMYQEMLDTYSESVGSADRELDIYLNSWEAKSERLRNSWVQLVASFKADDAVKGLLDVGNALMFIANTPVGNIAVVATTMAALNAAFAAFKATEAGSAFLDKFKAIGPAAKDVVASLKNVVTSLRGSGGLQAALGAAKTSFTSLGKAIYTALGPVGLMITAVYALVKIWDVVNVSAAEQKEKIEALSAEYEETVSTLESLNSQYEDTKKKIEDLNQAKANGDFSIQQQEELDALNQQNLSLERQIILQEKLNEIKKADLNKASQVGLEKGFSGSSDLVAKDFFTAAIDQLFNGEDTALFEYAQRVQLYYKSVFGNMGSQADYLAGQLDALNQKKEEFIAEHGDQSGWTAEEVKQFEQLDSQLLATQETAISVYNEMQTYIDGLTDEEEIEKWQEISNKMLAAIVPMQALKEQIDLLKNSMDEASQSEFDDMLEEMQADGEVTAEEIQKLLDKFPQFNSILADGKYSLADLAEYFTEAANASDEAGDSISQTGEDMDTTAEQAEALADSLNTIVSSMKTLTDAQEELNTTGALSLDTVLSLIEKYPELNDVLLNYLAGVEDETALQTALSEQYQKSADDYKSTIAEKLADNETFYRNVVLTNSDAVAKLKALGLTDLENYKSVNELKQQSNLETNEEITRKANQEAQKRVATYNAEAQSFVASRLSMLESLNVVERGMALGASALLNAQKQVEQNKVADQIYQDYMDQQKASLEDIQKIINDTIKLPDFSDTSDKSSSGSSGGSGSGSTKSWYEEQIEAMQELVSQTHDTNTLLEKEDKNSAEKRIQNLKDVQNTLHETADEFRRRGLSNSSDEIKQLKLMWHDLADDIQAVYQSMYDDLMEGIADDEWELELFKKNRERADRSVEEIAADNAHIVASYQQMQKELAELGAYYRSMGYDETDDLIQDLSDAWWEYQEKIESVYDSLTEAFEDYISESDRQIKALERTTGTAGQQIELYTKRIQEAQKAIAELQKTNVNGINDDRIGSIQDQIYSDEDAIKDIQDSLWDELENAIDREFDKKQDEIDDAQKEVDRINDILDKYDEELAEAIKPFEEAIEQAEKDLEDALEPIEDRLDDLNDRLEAEQKALEALTDPLNKQIEGYYEVNPDGSLGVYVPGLNDQIEDLQDQLDAENEKWEEQQEREEEALQLQKKELALQEAIKNLEQAQLDLETARNERTVYTLKDGVWAWRADESAIKDAEEALEDAEQAKEDAENDLEDFKEEQAHKEIVKLLENQIKALEKQKEQIEAQIEIYEKESKARQEYLQDLIDQAEAEKEAKEDYYNKIIEQNQKEIDAREEYYENLKSQYDDELEFWETRVEELQAQYDEWAEQWEDIQDAMTGDVRSIEEILADIANYGTPAMKEQIDRVTDLLEQMGVAIGDFNSSIGNSGSSGGNTSGGGSLSDVDIINQMKANSELWKEAKEAGDTDEMKRLEALNQSLAAQLDPSIGAWLDHNGVWWDKDGNRLYDMAWLNSFTGNGNLPSGSSGGGQSSGGASGGGPVTPDPEVKRQLDNIRFNAMYASDADKRKAFAEANSLAVQSGAVSIPYSSNVNDWMWKDPSGNWMYDQGGIASGKGVMLKGVESPEVVLSPVLAADVLNPIRNQEFMQFADALGIMFSTAHDFAADLRATPATVSSNNTDSHNVYINGVQIGESMMQKPLSETLSLLGIHRNM